MARSMGSQGDEEGGKRLVPSLHAYLPQSIWARLHPHGCRLHTLMDLELRISTARHGLGWHGHEERL